MNDNIFLVAILILFVLSSRPKKEKRAKRHILLTDDLHSMDNCCEKANSYGIKVIKPLPYISGMVCEIEDGQDQMLLALNQNLTIEEDVRVYAVDNTVGTAATATDSISLTGAPLLWKRTKGKGISVAVIDTGIANHPDITIAGGISTLGEVNTDKYLDDNGHGTHVAGIIGANGGRRGLLGMAPEADLYAVKALDKDGSGFVSDIIEAIVWAVENKMHIANMSLGTSESSEALRKTIRKAAFSPTIIVAAAGNSGRTDNPDVLYPAKYPEVISVGSANNNGDLSDFSSYGRELDLLAYGNNILSTYLGRTYRRESGTSMAAPQVTGALALMLSLGYRNKDAYRVLINTAKKAPLPPEKQGYGLLDLSTIAAQF
jgi:subtilisin family serine protease